ncbi:PspC domain-containing protein [Pelomonas sp. APW6]|uniref:PspC domain-containing protein n=1 Tax=Roseateles subflavus TaxID=3053353 RepID=A0ABT7LCL5_9BURK|nr:PspC domain-containing protein [Pelomonas sp. APW6]MDL5030606.1 PspC domain-containing protein [Pelomonas sp. APW6]
MSSMSSELERLAELHRQGHLSDDEFARAKARILQGESAAAGGQESQGGFQAGMGSGMGSGTAGAAGNTLLRRSLNDRWLGGVCGGLGRMTNVESWIWRLLFVLTSLCVGGGLLIYLLLWIFVPEE